MNFTDQKIQLAACRYIVIQNGGQDLGNRLIDQLASGIAKVLEAKDARIKELLEEADDVQLQSMADAARGDALNEE